MKKKTKQSKTNQTSKQKTNQHKQINQAEEDIDDTKRVIRIRKSNKNRQHNGKK
jgi:hypothetical protein